MESTEKAGRFPAELGLRLRSLRQAAKLSQLVLSRRMGRLGRYSANVVSRLEHGKMPRPGLGLIADYLSACGATFADLSGLPGMPQTASETAGSEQPKPKRKARVLTREQKLAQIERKAGRTFRQLMLEEVLYELLRSGTISRDLAEQTCLAEHGRNLFAVLERARNARQRLRRKAIERKGITREQVELVEHVVEQTFSHMDESGDLDRTPDLDPELVLAGRAKLARVRKAEERIGDELRQELEAWGLARNKVIQQIRTECVRRLTDEGVPQERVSRMNQNVSGFCAIAEAAEPGSEERNNRAWAIAVRARDEEVRQRLLDLARYVFRRWDELKSRIPARPRTAERKKR